MQRAMPLAHHHIHAGLAAAVGRDAEAGFGPASRWVLVDGQSHIFGAGEGGGSGGDEEEAGLGDLRSRGMNVEVRMCVPVVLTFQLAFHISRWLSLPAATSWSNWAPRW